MPLNETLGEAMTQGAMQKTNQPKTEHKTGRAPLIVGTNCYNCKYISGKEEQVSYEELNAEGGIDPKNQEDLERAKNADLITLPSGEKTGASSKRFCHHPKVKMYVTARMCCVYWDNEAVKRPWNK